MDEVKNLPQRRIEKFGQAVDFDAFMELMLFSYNAQLTARLKDTHRIFHEFDVDQVSAGVPPTVPPETIHRPPEPTYPPRTRT